jgi:hypothetical protein
VRSVRAPPTGDEPCWLAVRTRVGADPRVGVGAEQLRVVPVLADREQAQVADHHVVRRAACGVAVPVDRAGDGGAAAVALQLRVDVDEWLRRGSGRGEGQDGRRDDEQGERHAERRPDTAWVAGVDWP